MDKLMAADAIAGPRQSILLWFIGIMVTIGIVSVLTHRFIQQSKAPDASGSGMTRPVLAVLLVGAIVILAAASLGGADEQSRNILIGGVISLSSTAAAFYFASSGATEARQDLLQATGQSKPIQVPDLVGKTIDEANAILSRSGLSLLLWDPKPPGDAVITAQNPAAGTTVSGCGSVTISTTPVAA